MSRWLGACAALLLTPSALIADEEPRYFSSSAERVTVIELYTSEGCSSCPPADRWLSSLRDDPGLWTRLVPVAFHVDYWDYLGWRDRFASRRYGERQRLLAENGGASTVYTPGLFVNGKAWRGWIGGGQPDAARPVVGVLDAAVLGGRAELGFAATASRGELEATVAVLGMGLASSVAAGENRGRMLRHDFVALGDASTMMTRSRGRYEATIPLPRPPGDAGRLAFVAWVAAPGDPTPIQAVGGFL